MTRRHYTILQVIPRLDAGGAERTTLEMASAIARSGGRALVASLGGRLADDIEKAGGEFFPMPVHSKNPITMAHNIERLSALIRAEKVDLIHARSRAPAWSALAAARRCAVPLVTTYHGAHGARGPIKRWYNSSLTRSDCVIANSRFTADAIEKTHHIGQERLRVIPRGVDLGRFDPAKVAPGRTVKLAVEWGLTDEAAGLRLLLPARLTEWKGHEVAIEALAKVISEHGTGIGGGLTLVFCGDAQGRKPYEQRLRDRIVERGVGNMIHLVGDCADMPAAYSWADIVLAPSTRPEAFGRVAIEAGAMARSVIASAHGGSLETIVDGETGILVEPGSVDALASAIARLVDMTPEKRSAIGDKGRARATSVYAATAMCDATLRVYDDLLAVGG